jgi:ABC-type phosphate transport system substrate-binding protein
MKRIYLFSLLIVIVLMVSACSSTPSTTSSTPAEPVVTAANGEVSFSQDIMPVLQKFAARAHGNNGGVNLQSYDNVMKVVVPGSPEKSMLYMSLTGNGMPVMPPSGKLDDTTIQLFYDWIAQGAKNN